MRSFLAKQPSELRQYFLVTGNYWAFTLTDGALRMLVILHFHQLGYSPLQIALLFLFYEFFGIVTNLIGGWFGAHFGLNKTMNIGLALQVLALAMLLVPSTLLSVTWVMAAQGLSGIAKDLNKMSAKSSIKVLIPSGTGNTLYRWVAILTGSKNTLKGLGFFLGAILLNLIGFKGAIALMAFSLILVLLLSLRFLQRDLGKAKNKPRLIHLFSKRHAINCLSAARCFLFAARDIWFVIALPVYLASVFNWDHWQVGGFLALWVIAYGCVQSIAPKLTQAVPDGRSVFAWAVILAGITAAIASALTFEFYPAISLIGGLMLFGAFFAINSSLHSYLIISYADKDRVSMDVGFYYMANATGRLAGTLLSGWVFQSYGFIACLWVSCGLIVMSALVALTLPRD
jgi:predicted MFS family arabinose efflux permease